MVVTKVTNYTLQNIFRISLKETKTVFSNVDLEHFVNQFVKKEEKDEELNTDIFEKALYLPQIKKPGNAWFQEQRSLA